MQSGVVIDGADGRGRPQTVASTIIAEFLPDLQDGLQNRRRRYAGSGTVGRRMMKDGHDGVTIGRMMVMNRRRIRTRRLLVIDLHSINLDGNGSAGVGQELLLLRLAWLGSLDG